MRTVRTLATVTIVALAYQENVAKAQLLDSPMDVNRVTATALVDQSQISAGKPFVIAVEFHVIPGWHIYWQNPGSAGSATEMTVDLPNGFASMPVDYSIPETIVQPGGITMFGYNNSALLSENFTAPRSLTGGTVNARIKLRWLVCNAETCVPGTQTIDLQLTVASPASPTTPPTTRSAGQGDDALMPRPALADWQQRWFEKMPIPVFAAGKRIVAWGCTVTDGVGKLHVQFSSDVTEVEWYPMRADGYVISGIKVTLDAAEHAADITFSKSAKNDPTLPPGLLVYTDSSGRHGILLPPGPPAPYLSN